MGFRDSQDSMATRASLLSRLKDPEDQKSWQLFNDKYGSMIYNVACKAGLNDADAQDLRQDVLIELLNKMHKIKYDPAKSFRGFLMQTTRWRLCDRLRAVKPEVKHETHRRADDTRNTATMDRLADPRSIDVDAIWREQEAENLARRAAEKVQKQVSAKQFQIFDCHVIQGWPVKKVSKALGVSAGQVYLAKLRILPLMKKAKAEIEAEEDGPMA